MSAVKAPPTGGSSSKTIELTLTDLRDSTWNGIPAELQVQEDLIVKDVLIAVRDCTTLTNVRKRIATVLKESKPKNNKKYDICNPDCIRINVNNVGTLCNHDGLILLDPKQDKFPIKYTRSCNTIPHTRAVTNQEGKFYGLPEHNRAAFAVAELVDNSLAATVNNSGLRTIEIRFYENGKKSALVVLDNGCGMSSETLKMSLKYKAPKDSRQDQFSDSSSQLDTLLTMQDMDKNEQVHPMYINSNISKFGAGLKQAVFWLGGETRIITKTADNPNVCEVLYSQQNMEAKEAMKNEDAWDIVIHTGKLGQRRDQDKADSSLVLQKIIDEEGHKDDKASFTHVIIENLKQDNGNSPLLLLQRESNEQSKPTIEKQLAHIYHYYLHGRNGNTLMEGKRKRPTTYPIEIKVVRFDLRGNEISSTNLRDIQENELDLESRFVRTATPEPFLFTIEASTFTANIITETLKIGGIIRYHPFRYDHETNPAELVTRAHIITNGAMIETDNDEPSDSPQTESTQASGKSSEFFHLWWNGRLIPHTKLEAFNWCNPGDRLKTSDKLYKSYKRISGSLFLDSSICEITENKLNLTTTTKLLEMFDEKKIHTQQCTFQRVKRVGGTTLKAERVQTEIKKTFEKWLSECQKEDREVLYSQLLLLDNLPLEKKLGTVTYYQYMNAKWEELKVGFKVGDAVQLVNGGTNNSSPVLGNILCFYVGKENFSSEDPIPPESLHAPESYFAIELKPAPYYYGDAIVPKMEMRLIDKYVHPNVAKKLINGQFACLKLKFKLIEEGSNLRNGVRIPIDGNLFKEFVFDIVKEIDDQSVHGHLPYYRSKQTKKSIYVVARLHRIRNTGEWDLQYTGAICKFARLGGQGGYHFTGFEMNQIEDGAEIGEYVITFRSYVEVKPVHFNHEAGGSRFGRSTPKIVTRLIDESRTSSSPSSPASTSTPTPTRGRRPSSAPSQMVPDIDPPYEIEWEQEVDSLGRKILKDGDTKIRMPFYQIRFSVIAGPPHKFKADAFDEENTHQRIGIPFNIILSIKDSKGNDTSPENWELLTSQSPNIFIVPTKKQSDLCLSFTCGKLSVMENKLVINDVVAEGFLHHGVFKDCKIMVEMSLNNKICKCKVPSFIRFHAGLPAKIMCLDESLQIENTSRPSFRCRILDCSNNIIFETEEESKPILLSCNIYKFPKTEDSCDEPVCTGTVLATEIDKQMMSEIINLEELKTSESGCTEVTLICKISYDRYPNIEPASVLMQVVRSTRPEKLRVYRTCDDQELVEIENESLQFGKIGDLLQLHFKLFDCLDEEILYDTSKYKMEVTWSKDLVEDGNGILPTFQIPTRTEKGKLLSTKLNVLFYEEHILHKFYLKCDPLEPSGLNISFAGEQRNDVKVPMGQALPNIIAKVTDCHGNIIINFIQEEFGPDVELTAEDVCLNVDFDVVCGNTNEPIEGSFLIRNIRITSNNGNHPPLGEIMLTVTFKQEFPATLKLNVVPGSPKQLVFELDGLRQKHRGTYTIKNGTQVRVCARLIDEHQNPTKSEHSTRVNFSLKPRNEWIAQANTDRNFTINEDGEGVADFGVIIAGVSPKQIRVSGCKIKSCPGKCFGKLLYAQIHAELSGGTISELCYFHITCSDQPYRLAPRNIGGSGRFSYKAGTTFDFLTVTLEAEDESNYTKAEKEHLSLILTQLGDTPEKIKYPANNVLEGVYTFGSVPTKTGIYRAEAIYHDVVSQIRISEVFKENLLVFPGQVHSIKPEVDLHNLSVSNDTENDQNRVIMNNLKLMLKDVYDNPIGAQPDPDVFNDCGEHVVPKGVVHVQFCEGLVLENHATFDSPFQIVNGEVSTPELVVKSGLNLENNANYTITFTAKIEDNSEFVYNLKFTFYNNIRQQQEIRKLQCDISNLDAEIKQKQERVTIVQQNIQVIQAAHKGLQDMVQKRRDVLGRVVAQGVSESLQTSTDVTERENYLRATEKRLECFWRTTKSNIPSGFGAGEPHVLGPIGLLAEIKSEGGSAAEDIKLQSVISWFLQNKLEVIVTKTEAKGHEMEKRYPRSKYLLLEITKDQTPWNNTLSGPGNPVYAHTLLQFCKDQPEHLVKKVFHNSLGNTIVIDDLKTATQFMREYNKNSRFNRCPTILTRDGRRLTSDGIIGGSDNRVPQDGPRLKFGLAPSTELIRIQNELTLLPSLKNAMIEAEKFKAENELGRVTLKAQLAQLLNDIDSCNKQITSVQGNLDNLKRDCHTQENSPMLGISAASRRPLSNSDEENHGIQNKRSRMMCIVGSNMHDYMGSNN